MRISVLELPQTKQSQMMPMVQKLGGLRDDFNPNSTYTVGSTPVDYATASRLLQSGSVGAYGGTGAYNQNTGTYDGLRVFKDSVTGKLYVNNQGTGANYQDPDYGILMYPLSEATSMTPPVGSAAPCPCENCHEEIIQETWYASRERTSASDIEVPMSRDIIVCEPTEETPTIACSDELQKLKLQLGLNGLGEVSPAINDCLRGCISPGGWINDECINICRKRYPQIVSNNPLAVSPQGKLVSAQSNALVRTMNGLGNDVAPADASVTEGAYEIYTPPAQIIGTPVNCQKGNDNTVWFIVVGGLGLLFGILATIFYVKRR